MNKWNNKNNKQSEEMCVSESEIFTIAKDTSHRPCSASFRSGPSFVVDRSSPWQHITGMWCEWVYGTVHGTPQHGTVWKQCTFIINGILQLRDAFTHAARTLLSLSLSLSLSVSVCLFLNDNSIAAFFIRMIPRSWALWYSQSVSYPSSSTTFAVLPLYCSYHHTQWHCSTCWKQVRVCIRRPSMVVMTMRDRALRQSKQIEK